jgi:hypothetical protein
VGADLDPALARPFDFPIEMRLIFGRSSVVMLIFQLLYIDCFPNHGDSSKAYAAFASGREDKFTNAVHGRAAGLSRLRFSRSRLDSMIDVRLFFKPSMLLSTLISVL